jgi:hypothetical protein
VHYKEFSVLSVDKVFEREFYTSLFIERGIPFTDTSWGVWPPEAMNAWGAFSQPKNHLEREMVAKKYMAIAMQKIESDPAWYIFSRIRKAFYVWEKHFVYPYAMGHMSQLQKLSIYWGNIALVSLGILGIILYISFNRNTSRPQKMFGWFCIVLVVYISIVHVISTSEERFSLPAYPFLFIFAPYCFEYLLCYRSKRRV